MTGCDKFLRVLPILFYSRCCVPFVPTFTTTQKNIKCMEAILKIAVNKGKHGIFSLNVLYLPKDGFLAIM